MDDIRHITTIDLRNAFFQRRQALREGRCYFCNYQLDNGIPCTANSHSGLPKEAGLAEMEQLRDMLRDRVSLALPEDVGFVLVLANTGDGGKMTFSSDLGASALPLFKELITKLEDAEPTLPAEN